jgi:flagellar biosynthesis chaperone FliJ
MSPTIIQAINHEIFRLKGKRDSLRRSTERAYNGVMSSSYQRQLDGLDSQIQELQSFLNSNKG